MSLSLLFPVPLLVRDAPPALRDAIHAKVWRYLDTERARRDILPSPEESVSTSYYRPEASIIADAGLEELEQFVFQAARTFLEGLRIPPRELEIERAWINLFHPGAQEAQHTHDGSLLSCAYYVDAPKNCGCLVLPDPIAARRTHREFTKTTGTDLLTRSEIAVEPQPGRLVMFESWMPHYVQCNKSDRVRISIAINLREKPARTIAALEGARSSTPRLEAPAIAIAETPAVGEASAVSQASASPPAATSALRPGSAADARPFLFNEVFAVRKDLEIRLEGIHNVIPTVIVDNFLAHPENAREIVGSTPAANWKHVEGGRNFVDYYDCRLRFPIRYPNDMISAAQQIIRKVYSCDTRPADASIDVNWFKQIRERRADFAVPHSDMTNVQRSFTCVVYLNRAEECSGGTAFFRFKRSGALTIDETYVRAIREEPQLAETGYDYWPIDPDDSWELVGSVDMVPGRMLIFPSQYFHSAWHPVDSFYDFPRLTLAFWMVC